MAPSTATKPSLNGTNHVNGVSDEAFHTLIRHPEYYIQAADMFFLLRNVQFRVHRYFFERESAYFRAKLSAPSSPGTPKLGSSDSEPIVLTDVAPSDFEKLLWVFYNPFYSLYPAPASTWSAILALAHKWGFAEVKEFCVRELQMKTVEELGDIDRIVVYHDNDVDRNLLIPFYAALCAREQSLTLPEGLKLGMETTLVIASAREYVRGQIMADGSRTPITPNLEGDEMEKIVRDFFGIPIPEGSSASVNEVQAALSSLSLNARSEPRGPPPKLNVKTTNEPSGTERTPTVTASATVAAAARSIANGETFGIHASGASAAAQEAQEPHEEGEAAPAAPASAEGRDTSTDGGAIGSDEPSSIDHPPDANAGEGPATAAGTTDGADNGATKSGRPESPLAHLKIDTGSRPNTPTIGRKAGRRTKSSR